MKKDITVHYSFIQATFWMQVAIIATFASVYLLDLGINNSTIGLILSLGALCSAILQPILGNLIDNSNRYSTKGVLALTTGIAIVGSILLYPISHAASGILAILYGSLVLVIQLNQPFLNALGMECQNSGFKLLFGPARAIGSLGYALLSYFLGILTVKFSPQILPLCAAIVFLVNFLFVITFPLKTKNAADKETDSDNINTAIKSSADTDNSLKGDEKTSILGFLRKYKAFSIMLVAMVLIYFSHTVINSFLLQVIIPRGGNSGNMGVATSISAAVELVPMILFPFLQKKIKINHMLRFSTVFFTLKSLLTYLSGNVISIYLVSTLQMLGWAIMVVAIVYFVNENIGKHEQAQGQAFAGMSYTIANVLGGFIGGIIIDDYGINTLIIISTVVSLIGTVIFFIGINMAEKAKEKSKNCQLS